MRRRPPTVVIGIGNPMRRDDGIGPAVIAQLQPTGLGKAVELLVLDGEPTRLLDAWRDRNRAIVVDAANFGEAVGSIRRIEVGDDDLPWAHSHSSHGPGLSSAIALGRALGALPTDLIIFAIEAGDLSLGEGLTADVDAAVPTLVELITADAAVS